jgi:hypothetical protein
MFYSSRNLNRSLTQYEKNKTNTTDRLENVPKGVAFEERVWRRANELYEVGGISAGPPKKWDGAKTLECACLLPISVQICDA